MKTLETKLGYTFRDPALLERALTHSSYANENRSKGYESNERLEFLGDSVLGMVVADYRFRTRSDWPEGELTRFRASLVCEENLVNVARELADDRGVLAFWKKMIHLRKTDPVLVNGAFVPVHMGATVYAYERVAGNRRLLILCNMCSREKKLPKELTGWKKLIACNYNTVSFDTLRPFEFRLLEETR